MDWPMVVTPVHGRWQLRGSTRSGGRAFTGTEQVIAVADVAWRPMLSAALVRTDKKN